MTRRPLLRSPLLLTLAALASSFATSACSAAPRTAAAEPGEEALHRAAPVPIATAPPYEDDASWGATSEIDAGPDAAPPDPEACLVTQSEAGSRPLHEFLSRSECEVAAPEGPLADASWLGVGVTIPPAARPADPIRVLVTFANRTAEQRELFFAVDPARAFQVALRDHKGRLVGPGEIQASRDRKTVHVLLAPHATATEPLDWTVPVATAFRHRIDAYSLRVTTPLMHVIQRADHAMSQPAAGIVIDTGVLRK